MSWMPELRAFVGTAVCLMILVSLYVSREEWLPLLLKKFGKK